MKKLFLLAISIIAFSAISFGQFVTAFANANVAQGFGISNGNTLNFGSFVVKTSGSIVISPTGVRTNTGTESQLLEDGTYMEGSFSVSGPAAEAFQVIMPTGPTTLSNNGSTMSIPANSWTSNLTDGLWVGATEDSKATFSVGATLTFTSPQTPGNYTGSYRVEVAYE